MTKPDDEVKAAKKVTPWPLITIGVFGTVLIMAAVAMAWLQFFSISKSIANDSEVYQEQRGSIFDDGQTEREFDGLGRGGEYSRAMAVGVVSQLKGDDVTVIGGGKEVAVTMTDTTRVSGTESDLAVNDSVVIFGTKNDDDSITATRIVVRNDSLFEPPSRERPQMRNNVPSA